MRQIIAFLFFLLLISASFAEVKVNNDVFYAENGGRKLCLDIYRDDTRGSEGRCLIFVFGGGFMEGNKSEPLNKAFCTKIAEQGMTVAAMDYRYVGYGHEIASSPMERNVADVTTFIMNPGAIKSVDCTINDTTIPHSKIGGASSDSYYKK